MATLDSALQFRQSEAAPSSRPLLDVPTPARPEASEGPVPRSSAVAPATQISWSKYLALRSRVGEIAKARTLAMRRLTILRRANEELQNSFLALERHLPADASALDLIFADERRVADARVTLGWGSPGLEQTLPAMSLGLSAIELSFCDLAHRPGSLLHIQLTSLENQLVVDQWTVPTDRLAADWIMFALSRALAGPPRTLGLRLDFEGDADASVSLHVGNIQPARSFQVRNAATHAALRANGLTMRLWCGEPFSIRAAQPNLILADAQQHSAGGLRFLPVAQSLLADAHLANDADVSFDFAPVSHVAYRHAVACHPPARGMTIAALPLPQGAHVTSLRSTVEVGNEKSDEVEFALVLAADADRAKLLLAAGALPTPDEAVSPWTAAAFGRRAMLEATLAKGAHRHGVAFLATRMAKPGNNNFAWARFRDPSILAATM